MSGIHRKSWHRQLAECKGTQAAQVLCLHVYCIHTSCKCLHKPIEHCLHAYIPLHIPVTSHRHPIYTLLRVHPVHTRTHIHTHTTCILHTSHASHTHPTHPLTYPPVLCIPLTPASAPSRARTQHARHSYHCAGLRGGCRGRWERGGRCLGAARGPEQSHTRMTYGRPGPVGRRCGILSVFDEALRSVIP